MKPRGTGAVLALLLLAAGCGSSGGPKTSGGVRAVPVTRSVSLPVEQVRNPDAASNKAALTITSEAADELQEGPTGFDVMPDGGFLVTDPVRSRLVSYDSQGSFRWELPIQYRAETVRVLDNGNLEIVNATDSKRYIHVRDAQGNFGPPQVAAATQLGRAEVDAGQATLLNAAHGTIADLPGAGQGGAPLQVFFEASGQRMVSLRRLGRDAQNNSYVAVEGATTSDSIDVRTTIRKYAPDGRAIAEIQGIVSDSLVQPVEAFRQRAGILYQMATHANEVRMQVWDTNGVR